MMINKEYIAGELYAAYSSAVGGVNFQGDPLPSWEEFSSDPNKKKQSDAWIVAAERALQLLSNP